mmetsp:Transcript_22281/g.69793  ORF Transcript_22281/g.69793 Transcript_22281/m.69793 type:complete len:199 (+) Transcript_22281:271-867(+)
MTAHRSGTQTHTLTTDTPPADTATHPRVSELHSTSLKARVYCRAPPALLGQIAAYPICTLMTLGFLSLLPRRQVAGLSLAGRLSMYAYLLHPLVIFNPVVWLGQACLLRHIGCGAASTVAYLAFVVALWALLSSPLARLLCWPCVEPPVGRCCRPEAIEEGGGGAAEAEAAAGEATVAPLSPLPQAPAPPASITRQGA